MKATRHCMYVCMYSEKIFLNSVYYIFITKINKNHTMFKLVNKALLKFDQNYRRLIKLGVYKTGFVKDTFLSSLEYILRTTQN